MNNSLNFHCVLGDCLALAGAGVGQMGKSPPRGQVFSPQRAACVSKDRIIEEPFSPHYTSWLLFFHEVTLNLMWLTAILSTLQTAVLSGLVALQRECTEQDF